MFGYFIEVSKAKVDLAPEEYQRKQTMANAERFITPELKTMEGKILGADERAKQLEYEILAPLIRDLQASVLTGMQAGRRALRVIPRDMQWDWQQDKLWLEFSLPPGSYATALIRELGEYSDAA